MEKKDHSLIIKKFGGTSVGSLERISAVAERLAADHISGQKFVVVCSAMAGETNRLVELAFQVDPEERGLAYDMLLASGEQVSIALLSMALQKRGLKAHPLLAHQLGIYTDSFYSKARIARIQTESIQKILDKGKIPIVAGFQGINEDGHITTLGRGGSDTTAVALAVALKAKACEIYTDVLGVFNADPRWVPKARQIKQVSFEDMMEMSSLGSKVMHVRAVEFGAKYNVPIHVRSSFHREEGTWIINEGDVMEEARVVSLTHETKVAIFRLYPVPAGPQSMANIFSALSQAGIIVDIITQSQVEKGQRIQFSIAEDDIPQAQKVLKPLFSESCKIDSLSGLAKVSVVGVGMRHHPGVAAGFFETLAKEGIDIKVVTTSEIKISAVIDVIHLSRAANALHTFFGLSK